MELPQPAHFTTEIGVELLYGTVRWGVLSRPHIPCSLCSLHSLIPSPSLFLLLHLSTLCTAWALLWIVVLSIKCRRKDCLSISAIWSRADIYRTSGKKYPPRGKVSCSSTVESLKSHHDITLSPITHILTFLNIHAHARINKQTDRKAVYEHLVYCVFRGERVIQTKLRWDYAPNLWPASLRNQQRLASVSAHLISHTH